MSLLSLVVLDHILDILRLSIPPNVLENVAVVNLVRPRPQVLAPSVGGGSKICSVSRAFPASVGSTWLGCRGGIGLGLGGGSGPGLSDRTAFTQVTSAPLTVLFWSSRTVSVLFQYPTSGLPRVLFAGRPSPPRPVLQELLRPFRALRSSCEFWGQRVQSHENPVGTASESPPGSVAEARGQFSFLGICVKDGCYFFP